MNYVREKFNANKDARIAKRDIVSLNTSAEAVNAYAKTITVEAETAKSADAETADAETADAGTAGTEAVAAKNAATKANLDVIKGLAITTASGAIEDATNNIINLTPTAENISINAVVDNNGIKKKVEGNLSVTIMPNTGGRKSRRKRKAQKSKKVKKSKSRKNSRKRSRRV